MEEEAAEPGRGGFGLATPSPACSCSAWLEAGTPAQLLGELVGDGYESLVLGPADLGRTASKLEDQDAILGALHRTLLSAERDLPRYMAPHGAPAGKLAKDVAPPDASSWRAASDRMTGPLAGSRENFVAKRPLQQSRS